MKGHCVPYKRHNHVLVNHKYGLKRKKNYMQILNHNRNYKVHQIYTCVLIFHLIIMTVNFEF